jgi:hypothetical protein
MGELLPSGSSSVLCTFATTHTSLTCHSHHTHVDHLSLTPHTRRSPVAHLLFTLCSLCRLAVYQLCIFRLLFLLSFLSLLLVKPIAISMLAIYTTISIFAIFFRPSRDVITSLHASHHLLYVGATANAITDQTRHLLAQCHYKRRPVRTVQT